jgi:hypothetical protein
MLLMIAEGGGMLVMLKDVRLEPSSVGKVGSTKLLLQATRPFGGAHMY